MRVLVLGAYGLIGKAVSRHLRSSGYAVTGLARSLDKGKSLVPEIDWIGADISKLLTADQWLPHLQDIDVVVNAAGALQSGSRDKLAAVHRDSIIALGQACELAGIRRLVQVSAPGAELSSSTEFMRTKASADAALMESKLQTIILRPGLVLAPTAYGGTALLRKLSAFPFVQPILLADARVQTIWVDDLSDAVEIAVAGRVPEGIYDLAESEVHTLEDAVLAVRRWLGFSSPSKVLRLPKWLGYSVAKFADLAGYFGWRSPLRTTALNVLEDGVIADSSRWKNATGMQFKSLDQTLAKMHSTVQERVFARVQLVFPMLVILFCVFWIVSGLIGLLRHAEATAILRPKMSDALASTFVVAGSMVDICVGVGALFRRWLRPAAILSVGVAVGYMIAGTIVTPEIWLDPLGPFVKIFPAIGLGLVVAALAEER